MTTKAKTFAKVKFSVEPNCALVGNTPALNGATPNSWIFWPNTNFILSTVFPKDGIVQLPIDEDIQYKHVTTKKDGDTVKIDRFEKDRVSKNGNRNIKISNPNNLMQDEAALIVIPPIKADDNGDNDLVVVLERKYNRFEFTAPSESVKNKGLGVMFKVKGDYFNTKINTLSIMEGEILSLLKCGHGDLAQWGIFRKMGTHPFEVGWAPFNYLEIAPNIVGGGEGLRGERGQNRRPSASRWGYCPLGIREINAKLAVFDLIVNNTRIVEEKQVMGNCKLITLLCSDGTPEMAVHALGQFMEDAKISQSQVPLFNHVYELCKVRPWKMVVNALRRAFSLPALRHSSSSVLE